MPRHVTETNQTWLFLTGATSGVLNVKAYGAKGDGVTDDSAAIAAAINSGQGTPIEVYFPAGVYRVAPVTGTMTSNVTVKYSNVTLRGAGMNSTFISCSVAGLRDPNTNWEIISGSVWRGHGIEILSGSNAINNVSIYGMTIDGGSPRNTGTYPVWGTESGQSFPANTGTGEGWDITNKGIMIGNGTSRDNIVIKDVRLRNFRGEGIYYGGSGLGRMVLHDSILHDFIGAAISAGGIHDVQHNEIYMAEEMVENTPIDDQQYYANNYGHDCKTGIVVTNNIAPSSGGFWHGENNRIYKMYRGGFWVRGGINGARFNNNLIVDSGLGTSAAIFIASGPYGYACNDITIERNTIRADTVNLSSPFRVAEDIGYPYKNIRFIGNRFEKSEWVRLFTGTLGAGKVVNFDSTCDLQFIDNDFTDTNITIGDAPGSGDAAVPYIDRSNIFSTYRWSIGWDFVNAGTGSASTSSFTNVRMTTPVFGLVTSGSGGWMTMSSMNTSGIPNGNCTQLYCNDAYTQASGGVYIPALGTGWKFRRPYWLRGTYVGQGAAQQSMRLYLRMHAGVWHESDTYEAHQSEGALGFVGEFPGGGTPAPSTPLSAEYFWLSQQTPDANAPNIPMMWCQTVRVVPTGTQTYSNIMFAPADVPFSVYLGASASISSSTTLRLLTGTFSPSASGGLMMFVRPASQSVCYEISRYAF